MQKLVNLAKYGLIAASLIMLSGLGGCSWLKSTALDWVYAVEGYRLQPVSAQQSPIAVGHSVLAQYDTQQISLIQQIELRDDRMTVVGLGLLGNAVFSAVWDGNTLDASVSPALPDTLNASFVMRDLQFCFWPLAAVKAGLPEGWDIQEQAAGPHHTAHDVTWQRTVYQNGEALIRISYSPPILGADANTNDANLNNTSSTNTNSISTSADAGRGDPWQQIVKFKHLKHGYELTMTPLNEN